MRQRRRKIKTGIVNSGQQFVGDLISTTPSGWHSKGQFTVTIATTLMGAGVFSKGDDLLKKSDDALGDITNVNNKMDDLARNTPLAHVGVSHARVVVCHD